MFRQPLPHQPTAFDKSLYTMVNSLEISNLQANRNTIKCQQFQSPSFPTTQQFPFNYPSQMSQTFSFKQNNIQSSFGNGNPQQTTKLITPQDIVGFQNRQQTNDNSKKNSQPQLTKVSSKSSLSVSPLRQVTKKTEISSQKKDHNLIDLKATSRTDKHLKSESLDLARIVTKESTFLLKDIYNDIQSTLKKYDEIIKENQIHRQKNESLRSSTVKSIDSNQKKCNLLQLFIQQASHKCETEQKFEISDGKDVNDYQAAFQKQIKTLKEQQALLLLMLQNNTMQEQAYSQIQTRGRQESISDEHKKIIQNSPQMAQQITKAWLDQKKQILDEIQKSQKVMGTNLPKQLNSSSSKKSPSSKKDELTKASNKGNAQNSNLTMTPPPKPKQYLQMTQKQLPLDEINDNKDKQIITERKMQNIISIESQEQLDKSIQLCQEETQMNLPLSRTKEIDRTEKVQGQQLKNVINQLSKSMQQSKSNLNSIQRPQNKKQIIDIDLKKKRGLKRKLSSSLSVVDKLNQNQRAIQDISSIRTSPQSNNHFQNAPLKQSKFFPEREENRFGDSNEYLNTLDKASSYAKIHKKITCPFEFQNVPRRQSQINVFGQDQKASSLMMKYKRNKLWKDKIVEKIRCQQEIQKVQEMRQCTFKPTINRKNDHNGLPIEKPIPKLSQSKIIKADSTQSDLNRDLIEIIGILDEFQEFKQFLAENLNNNETKKNQK